MSDMRGALEVQLVRRRLARTGKAELAPLLWGDLASMACAAGVGGAGNTKSPPGEPDGLGVLLSSESGDTGTRNRRCHYVAVTI
jgi:hypothetical protein